MNKPWNSNLRSRYLSIEEAAKVYADEVAHAREMKALRVDIDTAMQEVDYSKEEVEKPYD